MTSDKVTEKLIYQIRYKKINSRLKTTLNNPLEVIKVIVIRNGSLFYKMLHTDTMFCNIPFKVALSLQNQSKILQHFYQSSHFLSFIPETCFEK